MQIEVCYGKSVDSSQEALLYSEEEVKKKNCLLFYVDMLYS